jgi:predicted ABC-type ATPase
MVRFIHLNGPPGIGKSTIASAFTDRHPGVLNLDIDRVAAMIGGWGDSFVDSFEAGRLLAAAMARVHLANGHDVIMPQMMTHLNARELADFESAAAATKAEYVQILLTANVEPSVDRCMERARAGDPRRDVVSEVIDERGGRDFVRMLHAQVTQFQLTGSRTQLLTASGSQSNRPARPSKLHSGRLDPAYGPPQEAAWMSTWP